VAESFTPVATDLQSQVEEYIVALQKEPKNQEYKSAKPLDVNIIGYNFGEAGQLQLSFDEFYHKVTGIEEVLMRAAIVKTFTQIDSIKEVEFLINGLPLSFGDVPVGRMEASMFIDSGGEMTSYSQTATISIYFANEAGDALIESQRQVEYDGSILLEKIIVEQLIDGPTSEEVGMKRTLPEGTILNEISKKDRVCNIDFNEKFLEVIEGASDEITIYSIVNTLVEQTDINKVQFTINGEAVATYKSIPLDQTFERKLNMIESEE
jgi:germination protein M